MATIFISYRRSDSAPYAGRLYDRLAARFGGEQLFMDLEIEPGEDFVARIEQGVSQCKVLIALIGPGWLKAADATGRRRLDDPADYTRIEVAAALRRQISVLPVLVGGAVMPTPAELPEELAPLARRQALEMTDARFGDDSDRLIELIEAEAGPAPAATPGSPRKRRWLVGAVAVAAIAAAVVLAVGALGGSDDGGGGGADADVVFSGSAATPQLAPKIIGVKSKETFSLANVTKAPIRLNAGGQQVVIYAGAVPIPPLGSGAYLLAPDTVVDIGFDDPALSEARLEFRADSSPDPLELLVIDFLD